MQFGEYVEGIQEALAHFVDESHRAGLDAAVPTTPGWLLRELISHQGGVHRWATTIIRGGESQGYDDDAGLGEPDPVSWLHDGGLDVVAALEEAPDELEALVFLHDAPAPREFWARRQCHETTIHAVDALAARLGRFPRAEETWIPRGLAADGIDELLRGFITRSRSGLVSDPPLTYGVRATDVDAAWTVYVSTEPPVTERDFDDEATVVLEAPAAALYLTLWNRSDEVHPSGSAEGWDLWRRVAKVG